MPIIKPLLHFKINTQTYIIQNDECQIVSMIGLPVQIIYPKNTIVAPYIDGISSVFYLFFIVVHTYSEAIC